MCVNVKTKTKECREMKLPQFIYPLFEQEALMIYDYLLKIISLFVSFTEKQTCYLILRKSQVEMFLLCFSPI